MEIFVACDEEEKTETDRQPRPGVKSANENTCIANSGNSNTSDMIADIEGKNFSIQPNDKGIQHVSFHFDNDLCTLNIKSDTEAYDITFGPRKWNEGETTKKGPYLVSGAKNNLGNIPPSQSSRRI